MEIQKRGKPFDSTRRISIFVEISRLVIFMQIHIFVYIRKQ